MLQRLFRVEQKSKKPMKIPKKQFISLGKRQKTINKLRLIEYIDK